MRTSINAPTVMNEDEDEISALRPFWPTEEDVDELQLMVARLRMQKQALLQSKRASAFRGDRREQRSNQNPSQAQKAELRRRYSSVTYPGTLLIPPPCSARLS